MSRVYEYILTDPSKIDSCFDIITVAKAAKYTKIVINLIDGRKLWFLVGAERILNPAMSGCYLVYAGPELNGLSSNPNSQLVTPNMFLANTKEHPDRSTITHIFGISRVILPVEDGFFLPFQAYVMNLDITFIYWTNKKDPSADVSKHCDDVWENYLTVPVSRYGETWLQLKKTCFRINARMADKSYDNYPCDVTY